MYRQVSCIFLWYLRSYQYQYKYLMMIIFFNVSCFILATYVQWRHSCEFGNNKANGPRTRAKTLSCSSTQTRLSQLSHIYLWCKQTIKRENYERSRSLRSARPWWLRRDGSEQRSDRAVAARYKSRTRAQIYDVALSAAVLRLACAHSLA